MSLSDKITYDEEIGSKDPSEYLDIKDVREAVKELKSRYDHSMSWDSFTDMVNEIFGDKLI